MKNDFLLQDKSILVTGASSGIGREIAIQTAALGARVILVGRSVERLKETRDLMNHGEHLEIIADLTDSTQHQSIITGRKFDGVVFNAGIVEYAPIRFVSSEKIQKLFDTNFTSAVVLCQQLLKGKHVNKEGSLVFISSISSKLGVAGTALYASSKAALSAFAKVAASEVSSQRIRSNSVSPGIIITPMTGKAETIRSKEKMDEEEKLYPLGYGSTKDVANLVSFLLSDASKWITGNDIKIDGGLTLN